MLKTYATAMTGNSKLGFGVATTYRPVGNAGTSEGTCAGSCAMLNNGCYAQTNPFVAKWHNTAKSTNHDLDVLLQEGAKLVRLHTAGDFFKSNGNGGWELDLDYVMAVIQFCKDNPKITVWTYTHDFKEFIKHNLTYAKNAFPSNFYLLASVDTLVDKYIATSHGFKTARVIMTETDKDPSETFCPYDLQSSRGIKPTVKCSTCKLCFNDKHKKDIAFIAKLPKKYRK
jgi:hypothetical protein